MIAFIHDQSFEGLLSSLFDAYAWRIFPNCLLNREEIVPLTVSKSYFVETCPEKAQRVFEGLRRRLSPLTMNRIGLVWLSEVPYCDELLFRFMRLVFDASRSIEANYAHPDVLAVRELALKVGREAHQVRSFVRFQKTGEGVYFAPIEPRYNVVRLSMPHFAARFHDQRLIIYDTGRAMGVYYDPAEPDDFKDVFLEKNTLHGTSLHEDILAENELIFRELWKQYVKATTIKERINPRLQARCMPRRYWKYLTEKQ